MTINDCSSSEMFSALFDGQAGAETVLACMPPDSKSSMYSDWNCYQLIGDSLRTSSPLLRASAPGKLGADPAFLHRLSARLTDESVDKGVSPSLAVTRVAVPSVMAANDHLFRWKLVAGFASLGAVAVLAWGLVGTLPGASTSQLAQSGAAPTLVMASPEGPMVRDARLEELLAAHKQLAGTSLQVPSGFVRNAGFEAPRQSGR